MFSLLIAIIYLAFISLGLPDSLLGSGWPVMYKELDANPNCEIVTATPEFVWLRISGEVEFTDSVELKQKVIDSNDLVKALYETGENPVFEVFTINGKATIADFSGEPPKTYEL